MAPTNPLSDPSFWQLGDGKQTVGTTAEIDVRKANWLAQLDDDQLRQIGFHVQNGFEPRDRKEILRTCENVSAAIDDEMMLQSTHAVDKQVGHQALGLSPLSGRVAELPPFMRTYLLLGYSELRMATGTAHRIVRAVANAFGVDDGGGVCEDLEDVRMLRPMATQRGVPVETLASELERMWSSPRPSSDFPEDSEYHVLRPRVVRVRNALYQREELRALRGVAERTHKEDDVRKARFMEMVIRHVVGRVLLHLVRDESELRLTALTERGGHLQWNADEAAAERLATESTASLGIAWEVVEPDCRVRAKSGEVTLQDLSIDIDIEAFEEVKVTMEPIDDGDFVDPLKLAIALGEQLTRLYAGKGTDGRRREECVEEATQMALTSLNKRYKLVGDCYVDTMFFHPEEGYSLIAMKKFRESLRAATVEFQTVDEKGKRSKHCWNLIAKFTAWNRQERYETQCFTPRPTPPRSFNMWTKFKAAQAPSLRVEQRDAIRSRLLRFFQHLKLLAGERPYDWMLLIWWVANMLQHPEEKSLCLVLMSGEGVGKSMFTRLLTEHIIGTGMTLRTSSPENNVWGKFNAPMLGKYLVELAEISKANMHNQYEKVLQLLEDDTFPVECKGVDAVQIKSFHHYIINSNNMAAVPRGRRFFPVHCSDKSAAQLDCDQCFTRMLRTKGGETVCDNCRELSNYHTENAQTFDALCGKAVYEYCISLDGVPTKLTSAHVRPNSASANIRDAARDIVDAWLEDMVANEFGGLFNGSGGDRIKRFTPTELHTMFKRFAPDAIGDLASVQAFQSRLGKKRLRGLTKKKIRLPQSRLQAHVYDIDGSLLATDLKLSGETFGQQGVLSRIEELREKLAAARESAASLDARNRGKLWSTDDEEKRNACQAGIAMHQAELDKLQADLDRLLSEEEVDDVATLGEMVPEYWRHFYDDLEWGVDEFLNRLFGDEAADEAAADEVNDEAAWEERERQEAAILQRLQEERQQRDEAIRERQERRRQLEEERSRDDESRCDEAGSLGRQQQGAASSNAGHPGNKRRKILEEKSCNCGLYMPCDCE